MKFAVSMPLDQTISFLTHNGGETTSHIEAGLWNTREEAETARQAYACMADESGVIEVPDEKEFRSRKNTW